MRERTAVGRERKGAPERKTDTLRHKEIYTMPRKHYLEHKRRKRMPVRKENKTAGRKLEGRATERRENGRNDSERRHAQQKERQGRGNKQREREAAACAALA